MSTTGGLILRTVGRPARYSCSPLGALGGVSPPRVSPAPSRAALAHGASRDLQSARRTMTSYQSLTPRHAEVVYGRCAHGLRGGHAVQHQHNALGIHAGGACPGIAAVQPAGRSHRLLSMASVPRAPWFNRHLRAAGVPSDGREPPAAPNACVILRRRATAANPYLRPIHTVLPEDRPASSTRVDRKIHSLDHRVRSRQWNENTGVGQS